MRLTINKEEVRKKIREQTISYMLAAFGLVVGLAWNEAIRSLIEFVFPLRYNTVAAKFVYAGILTTALVMLSMHINQLFEARKEEQKK